MSSTITSQVSKTIRGSRQYFVEALFTKDAGKFVNTETINLGALIKETATYEDRAIRLYTFSLSDYIIVREDNFNDTQLPLFIEAQELSRNRSRYLSMLGGAGNNFGTALAGSPSCIIEDHLPSTATFQLGFISQSNLANRTIYDPNKDYVGADAIDGVEFNNQQIKYCLVRFSVVCQYL